MDELGIIINKKGEYSTFGTWATREYRDRNNEMHWHDDSFDYQLRDTEWFKNLEIPYDYSRKITNQLSIFAQYGIIIILNIKETIDCIEQPALSIVSPENLTIEQLNTMNFFKEKLINWGQDNFTYTDIMDINGEYIDDQFYNIQDYYNYLENKKNKSI